MGEGNECSLRHMEFKEHESQPQGDGQWAVGHTGIELRK